MNVPPLAVNVAPPSIEYSNGANPPCAETVIVPSATLQSVGFADATFVIVGAFGAVKITGLEVYNTSQVPSLFLTDTLYVPALNPPNVFDACQLIPPSIENSTPGVTANVAAIEI